jgi:iron complex outermembrane receptor protein
MLNMPACFPRNTFDSSYPLLGQAIRAALLLTALGSGAVLISVSAAGARAEQVNQLYKIAAGPLSQVLNQFSRPIGVTMSSMPAQTQDRHSVGLQCDALLK